MTNSAEPSVLIVEDEPDLRQMMADSLEGDGFQVAQAPDGATAIALLKAFAYDTMVLDLRLPDIWGTEVLDIALSLYPDLAAVVMTGCGGVNDAVSAMRRGAIDFLIKPFQASQLSRLFRTEFERRRLRQENAELRVELNNRFSFDSVIGASPAIEQVFSTLRQVAPITSTVLIQGETGTGKELVARAIHHNSPRRDQRFVAFSAAAIPEGLVESELFGHTRGAFTGAVGSRVGRFELAHHGTLFIDEVGLMPLPLQAKLLRALQEREFERVGDARPVKFDARVIAASNVDLARLVKDGRFREDLYYRLNVIRVVLPPLRERVADITLLAAHFLRRSCRNNGLPPKTLTQHACRALMAYPWPGNVRQLENAIEHAVAMSGANSEVSVSALPAEVTERSGSVTLLPEVAIPEGGIDFTSVVSQLERDIILRCLQRTGGNKRQAARLLRLSRTTLIDKLHRLNLQSAETAA